MGDERYRIRADQLEHYAGHPDGVELITEHDVTPPVEGPRIFKGFTSAGVPAYEMEVTTPEARRRQPFTSWPFTVVAALALVTTVGSMLWVLVRG